MCRAPRRASRTPFTTSRTLHYSHYAYGSARAEYAWGAGTLTTAHIYSTVNGNVGTQPTSDPGTTMFLGCTDYMKPEHIEREREHAGRPVLYYREGLPKLLGVGAPYPALWEPRKWPHSGKCRCPSSLGRGLSLFSIFSGEHAVPKKTPPNGPKYARAPHFGERLLPPFFVFAGLLCLLGAKFWFLSSCTFPR